jgi:hypothetical protein
MSGEQTAPPTAKYLGKRAAAEYLTISTVTLDRLRSTGRGPTYARPIRKIIYDVHDLDAWMQRHQRASTSDVRNV